MPDGLTIEATAKFHVLLERFQLKLCIAQSEPLPFVAESLAAFEQAPDHAHGFVLPVPKHHWIESKSVCVGRQRAGPRAKNRTTS